MVCICYATQKRVGIDYRKKEKHTTTTEQWHHVVDLGQTLPGVGNYVKCHPLSPYALSQNIDRYIIYNV